MKKFMFLAALALLLITPAAFAGSKVHVPGVYICSPDSDNPMHNENSIDHPQPIPDEMTWHGGFFQWDINDGVYTHWTGSWIEFIYNPSSDDYNYVAHDGQGNVTEAGTMKAAP